MDIVTTVLAIWGAIVSTFVLYRDYLRAFRLDIRDAGRVQIAKNPLSEGLKQSCILLDLIFSNHGAKSGVIEDIAIHIHKQDESMLFRSLLVITDRTKNFQKELVPPKTETFIGFELSKSDSIIKQILFVPLEDKPTFSFQIGTYTADIWVISSKMRKWIKYKSLVFTVTDEDIRALDRSTIIPHPEDGGYFVKWITQDKTTDIAEKRLNNLKLKILK